jgi:cystathionine gamma-synthase
VRHVRASAHELELARRLRGHPDVEHVRYPGLPDDPGHARAAAQMDGFGTMVAFEVRGGAAPAEAAAKATRLIVHATSLGGIETTMERRARWPDEGDRLPPGLIRLSVGCEHVDDLWDDLVHALRIAAALR